MISKYFLRVGIAVSILLNVLLGGYSNQTFSARNYEWQRQNKPNLTYIIDMIFFWLTGESKHCMMCWVWWVTINNATKHIKLDNTNEKVINELRHDQSYE